MCSLKYMYVKKNSEGINYTFNSREYHNNISSLFLAGCKSELNDMIINLICRYSYSLR